MVRKARIVPGETWTEFTGPSEFARIYSTVVYPSEGYSYLDLDNTAPTTSDTLDLRVDGQLAGIGNGTDTNTWTFGTDITIVSPYDPVQQAQEIANAVNATWSNRVKAKAQGQRVYFYHLVPGDGNDVTITAAPASWIISQVNGHNGALPYNNHIYEFRTKTSPSTTEQTVTIDYSTVGLTTNSNITDLTVALANAFTGVDVTVDRENDRRQLLYIDPAATNTDFSAVFVGDIITDTSGTKTGTVIGIDSANGYIFVEDINGGLFIDSTPGPADDIYVNGSLIGTVDTSYDGFTIRLTVNGATSPQPNDYIYVANVTGSEPLLFLDGTAATSKVANDVTNDAAGPAPFIRLYHPADPVYWRTLNRPLIDLADNDAKIWSKILAITDGIDGDTNQPITEPVQLKAPYGYTFSGPVRFKDQVIFEDNNPIIQNVTSLTVTNRTITLNDGETGAGVSGDGLSGIIIDRGSLPDKTFRWNENHTQWELDGGIDISNTADSFAGTAWTKAVYIDIGSGSNDYAAIIFDSSSTTGTPSPTQYAWGIGRTNADENNPSPGNRSALRFISFDTSISSSETPIELRRNASLKQIVFDPYTAGWDTSFVGDVIFNANTSFSSTSNVTFNGTNTFNTQVTFNDQATFNSLGYFTNGLEANQGTNYSIFLGGANLQVQGDIWRTTNNLDASYYKLINIDTFDEIIVVVDISAGSAFTEGEAITAFGTNATVVKADTPSGNQQYIWVNTVTAYPTVGASISGTIGGSGTIVQIQTGGFGVTFNNRYLYYTSSPYAKGDQQFGIFRKDIIDSSNTVDRSQFRIDLSGSLSSILANFDIDYNTPNNSKLQLRLPLELLSGYTFVDPLLSGSDTYAVLKLNQHQSSPTFNQSILFDSARTGNDQALFWSRAVTAETARSTTTTSVWLDSRLGWIDRQATGNPGDPNSGLFFKLERGYDVDESSTFNRISVYTPRVAKVHQPGLYGTLVNVNPTAGTYMLLPWNAVDLVGFTVSGSIIYINEWARGLYRITININGYNNGANDRFIGGFLRIALWDGSATTYTNSPNWDGYNLYYDRVINLSTTLLFYIELHAGTTDIQTTGGIILIQPA